MSDGGVRNVLDLVKVHTQEFLRRLACQFLMIDNGGETALYSSFGGMGRHGARVRKLAASEE